MHWPFAVQSRKQLSRSAGGAGIRSERSNTAERARPEGKIVAAADAVTSTAKDEEAAKPKPPRKAWANSLPNVKGVRVAFELQVTFVFNAEMTATKLSDADLKEDASRADAEVFADSGSVTGFAALKLSSRLVRTLEGAAMRRTNDRLCLMHRRFSAASMNLSQPTKIQFLAIPHLLAGRDL